MKTRQGDWFLTFTGRQFWPLDPRPEDLDIHDIAHHLSLLCRFNGAVRSFYSVAQHSCIVADALPTRFKLKGLLHDATEAYVGDMVRPLKQSMDCYRQVEDRIGFVISERFGVRYYNDDPIVKEMDNRALMTERRDLINSSSYPWKISAAQYPPFPEIIELWSPVRAEAEFLARFFEFAP